MATDKRFDESISTWLAQTAPPRLPERVLDATFERTRGSRQQVGWRALLGRPHLTRSVLALGGAAVIVMAAALTLNFYANQPRVGGQVPAADPRSPFEGTWVSTSDADGGTQTMTVQVFADGAVEIVVTDDIATVCGGTPSTMTGTGRIEAGTRLVIPAPNYTCDDGSEPEALSGPPLQEQLRDWALVLDPQTDTLSDGFGGVWLREGAEVPSPDPTLSGGMWPQTSLEEVREAQELADAGDPRYTWQVDPELANSIWPSDDTEIVARFLREELGWEEFRYNFIPEDSFGTGASYNNAFIRCAPGRTNPLYPNDPVGSGCAPTIDDVRYERVSLDLAQLVRQDASGIWVVTRWSMIAPLEQVVPPSDAEATALLEAFLQARIDGRGAEEYVDVDGASPSLEVPLLYATTTGTPYERSEFELVDGPEWPKGWIRLKVRLFAEGGTVVEQVFLMNRDAAGRVRLEYEYNPREAAPTTENGQPVPVQYSFLDGEVTFSAAWPWDRNRDEPQGPSIITLVTTHDDPARYDARLAVVADPRPIGRGCEEGPAPGDIDALARSIQADPDLEATAPVAVNVGGIPALRMDVATAPRASICETRAQSLVVTGGLVDEYTRMRLYLLELPGSSPRILAIAMTAPKLNFEGVLELEAPLLDSFEFHAG